MRHAFSLVELSIVLVILGLLTGSQWAGQRLLRAGECTASGPTSPACEPLCWVEVTHSHALPGGLAASITLKDSRPACAATPPGAIIKSGRSAAKGAAIIQVSPL